MHRNLLVLQTRVGSRKRCLWPPIEIKDLDIFSEKAACHSSQKKCPRPRKLSEKLSLGISRLRPGVSMEPGPKSNAPKSRLSIRRHWLVCAMNVQIVCIEQFAMNLDLTCDATPPIGFDQFMATLRDSESVAPIISARRFAAALHVDIQTLARLAHVHRNTVTQACKSTFGKRCESSELRPISLATSQRPYIGIAMSRCQSSTTRQRNSWCRKDAQTTCYATSLRSMRV